MNSIIRFIMQMKLHHSKLEKFLALELSRVFPRAVRRLEDSRPFQLYIIKIT